MTKDDKNKNREILNTVQYRKEDKFFKNILDVTGYNVPGCATNPKKEKSVADQLHDVLRDAITCCTYNPGF